MKARNPDEIHDLFSKALAAGDVNEVMSLYELDAILVPGPDQIVKGHAAIRGGLTNYLATKPLFKLESSKVIHTGDIALLFSKWSIAESGHGGEIVNSVIEPIQVARRQSDGTWLVVIDKPSGS